MTETKAKLGDTDAGYIRRVGAEHAIYMPPRTAQLVDIKKERADFEQTLKLIEQAKTQVQVLELRRDQIQKRIDEFEAIPIDRVDGDPVVPQLTQAERSKQLAAEDAKAHAAELETQKAAREAAITAASQKR